MALTVLHLEVLEVAGLQEQASRFIVRLPVYSVIHFSFNRLIINLTGKLMNAWTETPTKWYPLPLAVGALLLVAIQYRRKSKRAVKEVELDENGQEVITLKGPWQVSNPLPSFPSPTLRAPS